MLIFDEYVVNARFFLYPKILAQIVNDTLGVDFIATIKHKLIENKVYVRFKKF